MWPWRLSAQIARTMKEVGNAEHENECVPERRFTRCSEDKSCLLPRKNSIPLGLMEERKRREGKGRKGGERKAREGRREGGRE